MLSMQNNNFDVIGDQEGNPGVIERVIVNPPRQEARCTNKTGS
jgi:hypothetical protein